MGVKIFSDSTCDLSEELIKRYSVTIIPLCIIMGDKSYYDGEGLSQKDIFKWADENKTTPKTAAITAERLEEAAKPVLEAGDDIILFTISSGMSSTFNLASIYAEDNGNGHMHIIDSANLAEIVKEIEGLIPRVRASFVVDTLTYLSRGGRCSSVTALLAGTLKLHPEIVVKDGAMGVSKKYRGSLGNSVMKYATDLEEALLDADHDRVFITHTIRESERAIVDEVRKYLESLGVFKEVIETRAGGVISSHCGPGTLGILFIK